MESELSSYSLTNQSTPEIWVWQFSHRSLFCFPVRIWTLKVDFYDDEKNILGSEYLNQGDLIMLIKGGHGFSVIENLEMIEIKQGPYLGNNDKVRFNND